MARPNLGCFTCFNSFEIILKEKRILMTFIHVISGFLKNHFIKSWPYWFHWKKIFTVYPLIHWLPIRCRQDMLSVKSPNTSRYICGVLSQRYSHTGIWSWFLSVATYEKCVSIYFYYLSRIMKLVRIQYMFAMLWKVSWWLLRLCKNNSLITLLKLPFIIIFLYFLVIKSFLFE